MREKRSIRDWFRLLGPGLLYAGAAVGVSHLVQSTKAGAMYGFALVWVVILTNVIKYPFFQFGPRYAAATGESLIAGYRRLGPWATGIFVLFTISTMFTVQAAVTIVTAGIIGYLTGSDLDANIWAAIVLTVCSAILIGGRYQTLDLVMKIIIVLLSVATLVALAGALSADIPRNPAFMAQFDFGDAAAVGFLITLMGWMPAPVDISIWHSVWSVEKSREEGKRVTMKHALLDFNIGYWGTTLLAVAFLALGALVMYGSGEELPKQAAPFAGKLISMYSASLGSAIMPFVALAALATMFSTTLTCLDAYPRVLTETFGVNDPKKKRLYYMLLLGVVSGGAILMLVGFAGENMAKMLKLATTLSFVTAPVLALMNHLAITSEEVPEAARPSRFLRIFSITGIVLLSAFGGWYVYITYLAG